MKRLAVAVVAALSLVALALPAGANHANNQFYTDIGNQDDQFWGQNGNYTVCISGEFANILPPTMEANAILALQYARTEVVTGSDFGNANAWDTLTEPCGDFDWWQEWQDAGGTSSDNYSNTVLNTFCANVPEIGNRSSSIQFESIHNTDVLGRTIHCDRNNNGFIDYFVTVINEQCYTVGCGPFADEWHFDPTATPGSGEYDLRGVATHELVHGTGWYGHLTSDCTESPSLWNTMCNVNSQGNPSSYGSRNRGNGQDFGTYDRTLDTHDLGELSQY